MIKLNKYKIAFQSNKCIGSQPTWKALRLLPLILTCFCKMWARWQMLQLHSYIFLNWTEITIQNAFGEMTNCVIIFVVWILERIWTQAAWHQLLHIVCIINYSHWCFQETQKHATSWTLWLVNCFALGHFQCGDPRKSTNIPWLLAVWWAQD